MRPVLLLVAALAALGVAACSDTIVTTVPTQASSVPVGAGGVPVPGPGGGVIQSVIEFRANGNATSVRIRYSTPIDGLVQVVTTLPYNASFRTSAPTMFLALDVTPLSYPFITYPFLSAQIVANGSLFREATSSTFMLETLSVSGTWRP